MSEKGEKGRRRAPILSWRGVLSHVENKRIRRVVGAMLALASAVLTYTQLGFICFHLPGGDPVYCILLLIPVALSALLLGTVDGTLIGLFAGCMLYIHARTMPLDYYELSFVNPVTSIIMLGVSGLLFGVLFAFVLRNNPSRVKRYIYIAIVCVVISWMFSEGFIISVIIAISVQMTQAVAATGMTEQMTREVVQAAQNHIVRIALRLGNLSAQAWFDAIILIVVCVIGDLAAERMRLLAGAVRLRSVFALWLTVAVVFVFMVTAALSFIITTQTEMNRSINDMRTEVVYLCRQLAADDLDASATFEYLKDSGVDFAGVDLESDEDVEAIFSSAYTILDGYTLEDDGLVVVLDSVPGDGEEVLLSNDPSMPTGVSPDEVFSEEILQAIEDSADTGEAQRSISDDTGGKTVEELASQGEAINSEIVYVMAQREGAYTVAMIWPFSKLLANRSTVMLWLTISTILILAVVFLLVFMLLERVVARRIDEENAALARITAGELDVRAEAGGSIEFESLSAGINKTVDALKGWIAEAEQRMDAELATAHTIQQAALPRTFPPYPDILKFDIYASMNAASHVGGDFYDFFLIGEDCDAQSGKLGFMVADVAGKGVPAALFMMKAKTQIRDYVGSGMELGEAVTEANRQLVDGNGEGMFVTAWIGVLDYGTGRVDYVNAGHNPPLMWQRDGGWRWMKQRSGPMLGVYDVPYRAHSVDCLAGDTLLLYTDGVTEAFNQDEELYGTERLLAIAEEGYRLHPRELLESVRNDVAAFTGDAVQSDDITMLTLEVGVPPEVTATLMVPAEASQFDRVIDFIHAELDRWLCPKRAQNQIDIAVEELFVNVCSYAYPDATPADPGTVRIQRTHSADPFSITIDIIDDGIPFNPVEKPDAVTPTNIEDVPVGGLGILMVKKMMDEMRYERTDGSNIVTIVKKW